MATLTQMVKEQDEIVPTRPYTSTKDIYNGKKSDFQFFVGTNFSVFFPYFSRSIISCHARFTSTSLVEDKKQKRTLFKFF
jgi:hypothetical protein